jgi:hypothetical protein
MKARTITYTQFGYQRRVFWALVIAAFFSIAVYMYGISMSIVNVVIREQFDQQASKIDSHVAVLEAEYLQKKEALSLASAEASGFSLLSNKEYVTRGSLSYNISE